MASISSPGIGSGLDINGLIASVIEAERTPATNRLALKEATYQAQLTAYGSLKGALSSFNSALNSISSINAFSAVSTSSSDADIVSADATDKAANSSYRIKVSALAQPHTLVTTGFSNITEVVGTGTVTFKFGTTDYVESPEGYNSFIQNADKPTTSVTIDATNNTLEGIRDAVNNANVGVSASIIYDGTNYRLTYASTDTGAASSMEVTVDDPSLSALEFNSTATNLEQTLAGQDAAMTINGLAVTSATNVVKEAVSGVTFNLKQAQLAEDAAVNIDVSRNNNTVSNAVQNFVAEYNALLGIMNELNSYNADTQQGGILLGDSVLRSVEGRLRREVNNTIEGLSSRFQSLAEIGITTERDGTLEVDNSKLDAAVSSSPEAVGYLFAVAGQLSSNQVNFVTSTNNTKPGEYAIDITQAATQGSATGTVFGYSGSIVIDSNNDTFSFTIDDQQTGTITLTPGTYSGVAFASELQARINGATALKDAGVSANVDFDATVSNERFIISSTRYGSDSKVNINAVEGSGFGLSVGAGVVGLDVAGTIGGQFASGSGRLLTGTVNAAGLTVEILGDAQGDLGTISFARGIADKLSSLIDGMLNSGGALNIRIDGVEDRIEGINEDRVVLGGRMAALESRLLSQFLAMDLLVSQLRGTSNFLNQQLESLPKIGDRR
ncbi:Flagellar hook-associated protein FliD [hydrothermal vent metagenome]|uniref:Filament cap protein n=1 Tax=hydrothermal vent metagenome TaxID=652676 RepID=A0A3B1A6C3_9ZZZZ